MRQGLLEYFVERPAKGQQLDRLSRQAKVTAGLIGRIVVPGAECA